MKLRKAFLSPQSGPRIAYEKHIEQCKTLSKLHVLEIQKYMWSWVTTNLLRRVRFLIIDSSIALWLLNLD